MEKLSYLELMKQIEGLKELTHSFFLGKSTLGESIYGFHIGSKTGKQILVEAGIHAREYISTLAVLEEIKFLLNHPIKNNFGIYFIPLMNPDGVRLVLDGIETIHNNKLSAYLKKINNNSSDFSLWKANILGVDLNSNFDALWGTGKFNKFHPSSSGFVGYYPNSEIENRNLIKFLATHKIYGALSIHTKGEVVYYGYDELSQSELSRDETIATIIAQKLGFTPEKTYMSVGGVSDYISKIYHVPTLTIELGSDKQQHPISSDHLPTILPSFLGISSLFTNIIEQYKT